MGNFGESIARVVGAGQRLTQDEWHLEQEIRLSMGAFANHRADLPWIAYEHFLKGRSQLTPLNLCGHEIALLSCEDWMPDGLCRLSDVSIQWRDSAPQEDTIFAGDGRGHVKRAIGAAGKEIHDAPLFRILDADRNNGKPRITVAPGRYFQYYESCEYLDFELRTALYRVSRDGVWESGKRRSISEELIRNEIPKRCPVRTRAVQQLVRSPATWFEHTCAATGLNLLTVLVDPGAGSQFLRHLRGDRVAEGAQTYHVVPAGTFQPPRTDAADARKEECSLAHTALREFGEELLNRKELQTPQTITGDLEAPFRRDRVLQVLLMMYRTGTIRFFWLGMGLDPLTMKPELLGLALIDYPFVRRFLPELVANWEGKLEFRSFSREELLDFARHDRVLPAGAGCAARTWTLFDSVKSEIDKLKFHQQLLGYA